ncbi:MAG: hydrogenase maturation protease [Candidatus Dormibacteria bacterium]
MNLRMDAGEPRILISGAGNVLRGDDGFGIILAGRLAEAGLPDSVTIMESGMAGLTLVQEMLNGYQGVIVLDVVVRNKPPGTLVLLEPRAAQVSALSDAQRAGFQTNTHETDPSRSFFLAQAMGCMPPRARVLGCEPLRVDDCISELSAPVAAALPEAERMVVTTVHQWLAEIAAEPVPA